MRLAAVAVTVLLASCAGWAPRPPASAFDRPVLGPLQTALLYHQRSGTVAPDARLVHWFGEVCGELDDAARRDAIARSRASLAEVRSDAAATTRWVVPIRQTLGGYDLAGRGFPTSLRRGAVIRFDRGDYCDEDLRYLLVFENGGTFASIEVPRERALEFVRSNPARRVVHEVEVEVVGAQADALAPALVVEIIALRTRDAVSGAVLAESRGSRKLAVGAAARAP
jgi:hypothetical protein